MSSILTNNGAMVALDTLRNINRDLAGVQSEISTGKKVANAKDNSAVWAISTVMSSDVESFKQINDSLNLGSSTVGVARSAAEQITSTLTDMKALIVSAQEGNVDRAKIQTEISALRDQVGSIVGAAQFNGSNLIDGSSTTDLSILASLDRSSNGVVTTSSIDVGRVDLALNSTGTDAVAGAVANADQTILVSDGANSGTAATVATGADFDLQIASVGAGLTYTLDIDDSASSGGIGTQQFQYVANANDSAADVATNIATQVNEYLGSQSNTDYAVSVSGDTVTITNNTGNNSTVTGTATTGGTAATAGGLGELQNINVSTDAAGALAAIDGLIEKSVNAAASFGSAQSRLENQNEFVTKLTDSLTSGIGSLVDADMEAASAKLQALQVQQQLGTQALSIANQAPQGLLALFR